MQYYFYNYYYHYYNFAQWRTSENVCHLNHAVQLWTWWAWIRNYTFIDLTGVQFQCLAYIGTTSPSNATANHHQYNYCYYNDNNCNHENWSKAKYLSKKGLISLCFNKGIRCGPPPPKQKRKKLQKKIQNKNITKKKTQNWLGAYARISLNM